MNLLLFWTYIATILILISVILVIILVWRDYFPRRWLNLLVISFSTAIGGIISLLLAELEAPYNSNFYINPFFYLIYFGLTGISMLSIYLLVLEIHFKHIKLLLVLGFILFTMLIIFIIVTIILLLLFQYTNYPLISYLAFECMYSLGIVAYILLAIGSFSHVSSDRLEQNIRRELIVVGIFSLGFAFGLILIAMAILYVDFSIALDPAVSIFWLLWISLVSIIFLLMVRRAIVLFTR
ncbi:MAG: hypothetical protein ACFFDK_10555 [Promethearchaeota archaeon]